MGDGRAYGVFDVESNGFKGTSVLSASSIVFGADGKILDYFNRFYFPEEGRIDPGALRIHRLTLERLAYFRLKEGYSGHFLQDAEALADFWLRWEVRGIIIHNLNFDISFLPKTPAFSSFSRWCSMTGLTDFAACPGKEAVASGRGWGGAGFVRKTAKARGRLMKTSGSWGRQYPTTA